MNRTILRALWNQLDAELFDLDLAWPEMDTDELATRLQRSLDTAQQRLDDARGTNG